MCLIVFALDCHPRYGLVLAANRDEYFSRPTAPAAFWKDTPQVCAGRDIMAGGTWLGVTKKRRVAAVTYYREQKEPTHGLPSRGKLAADFLAGAMAPEEYLTTLQREAGLYGGFNLLFGNEGRLFYYTNRGEVSVEVPTGIHGLSNGLLDKPWPKVVAARDKMRNILANEAIEPEALFQLLADRSLFPDPLLPETGVGIERERHLSPIFVAGNEYGTRCSTILMIDRQNRVTFLERTFNELQGAVGTVSFTIRQ